jgi:phytoene synthase
VLDQQDTSSGLAGRFAPAEVEASYAACRRLCRRSGSNFPGGFRLLPAVERRAMDALYAFMRHSDDLVDAADGPSPQAALTQWRADLERSLQAAAAPVFGSPEAAALLPALADAVRRFQIPPEHLRAVLDGVEMDLDRPRYETFAALAGYCERVASAVGLACIHVWGFRGPEALGPARSAGIALQLTNILRDLKEDAAAGRVYLPLEDLRQCGYSIEQLQRGVAGAAFRRLMDLEVGRTEEFYRDGAALLEWLAPPGQRLFGMMTATYRALLRKIARRPEDLFRRRIRVSGPKKLRIALRWALLPPRMAGLT